MTKTFGVFGLVLGVVACSSGDHDIAQLGEDEGELSSKACVGAACPSLLQLRPLLRGGLAAKGDRLYWLAASGQNDADGYPIDELQSCQVPACSTVDTLRLVQSNGKSIGASALVATSSAVFFRGDKHGQADDSFFLTDGQTISEIHSSFDTQHDRYAVDASGLAILTRDRRTDGWARSNIRHCAFAGMSLATGCANFAHKNNNYVLDLALSPSRLLLTRGTGVVSVERSTLAGERREPLQGDGGISLFTLGELTLSAQLTVTSSNGKAVHNTTIEHGGTGSFGVVVPGVLRGSTATATHFYVATHGEGDVWATQNQGVVARVSATGAKKTIATQQNAGGVAVALSKVYWLDRDVTNTGEDWTGLVRYANK